MKALTGVGSSAGLGISERKTNMKKDKSGEVKPENNWWCQTCQQTEPMTVDEMKVHIKEKHGYDPTNFKGWRSMLMHTDGDTWFSYQWQWTLNHPETKEPIVLTQYTLSPRAKDDMMRYA